MRTGPNIVAAIASVLDHFRRHGSRLNGAQRPFLLAALGAAATGGLLLTACSGGGGVDSGLGVTASPRVVHYGSIPKGGGVYKVGRPYQVAGRWYRPHEDPHYDRTGIASWYGTQFHGRKTSNGEIYDMNALTAGHPTLPMPSYAYVTNLQNGRTILVRINDRGPYAKDRLIDLSYRSAHVLGFHRAGLARVRVRYAGRAPLNGDDSAERRHLAAQGWFGGGAMARADTGAITTASIGATVRAAQSLPSWSFVQHRRSAGKGQRAALGVPPADVYVRVGPFETRSEGERFIHIVGSPDDSTIEAAGEGAAQRFNVRFGPYGDRDAATAMARIAEAGFAPQASTHATVEGDTPLW